MVIIATVLWDVLVADTVMREAKLRSVGVSTAIEILDAILSAKVRIT